MTEFSFGVKNKIREQGRFKEILRYGKQFKTELFNAYFITQDNNQPRLGITQRKKIFRSSVQRHLISRIIRESFRNNKKRLGNKDIIIFPKNPNITSMENKMLFSDLDKIWYNIENKSI
jgi:ribonuclease P protein component